MSFIMFLSNTTRHSRLSKFY